ncbi:cytochrome P450 [Micromonospora sp. NPDC005707]|uniref:cytochrome P450 family protein n=1 Tax=Micromonospora sp. NPDC005707 TaxID=3157050 RepID=UPI00340709E7
MTPSPELKSKPPSLTDAPVLGRTAPVRQIALPHGALAWLITNGDEVRHALAHPHLIKDGPLEGGFPGLPPELALAMSSDVLHSNPPDHGRLRKLVSAAFTRRRTEALAPRIQELTDDLLDAFADRDQVDLVPALTFPLPFKVIAELLGVPAEDSEIFQGWANTITQGTLARPEEFIGAATRLVEYARTLIELKRREPADDLLSGLVGVSDGGDRLSEDELTSMVFLMLIAGHATTTNLIGNGVHDLLTHPETLAAVRADPERLPTAIEEFLRYEAPLRMATPRRAAEDVSIGGATIPRGDMVFISLVAANHDPALFAEPERFDIGREKNAHLSFGHGLHHCMGAPLARLEARIAIGTLLARFPKLRLAVPPEQLTRQTSILMNGWESLPVALR